MTEHKEYTQGVNELVSRAGKYLGETVASNMMTIDRLSEMSMSDEERKLVGKLLENNLRLLRFMRLYTTFALYKYGTEDFYPKNSDIAELLTSICRQTREVLGDTVILEASIPDVPVVTVADCKNLRRCILALLSNAVHHCEKRVCLSLKKTKEGLEISVSDDGKKVDKIMKQRIEEGLSGGVNNVDGSGMGLAIAAMIIKSHGGELKFIPHKSGNEFLITMPERVDNTLMFSSGIPEYGERYNPTVVELCEFYFKNIEDRE